MVRSLVLMSGAVLMLGQSAVAWAGPQSPCPRPCPNVCVPNVGNFGYFPTTWRQWPAPQPLEQTNPRSIGAQVLPTPVGEEPLPTPPVAAPPQSPLATPEAEKTPPEAGTIVPPERVVAPEPPVTSPAPSAKPSIESGLPGLPMEPDQLPRPAAPLAEPPKEMPKAQEPAKPNDTLLPARDKNLLPKVWRSPAEQTTKAAEPGEKQPVAGRDLYARVVAVKSQWNELPAYENRANLIADAPDPPASKVEPVAYVTPNPAVQPPAVDKVAAPPVALSSYCVVELVKNGRWAKGDLRWTVVHQGWIYRFSGPTQRQQFLADPDAFAPINSGNDPVLTVDENRSVAGQAAYCALYNSRLYTFSSAATQARFNEHPQRYAAAGK